MSKNWRYFEFEDFRLDTVERVLLCRGEKIPLTHKAFHLLLTLVENKGNLLKHNELMDEVWKETAVDQSSLKQNIALLRKALGDTSDKPKFIQTMPKYGYRFIASVKTLPDENIALISERHTITQIDIEEDLPAETKLLKPVQTRKIYWLLLSVGLIGLLILLIYAFNSSQKPKPNIFSVNNIIPSKLTDVGNVGGGSLSPNGEFVVYNTFEPESGSALWVRRVESKEPLQLLPPSLIERPGAFTITNDGNWIYYIATNGNWGKEAKLSRISILGGKPHKVMEHLDSFVSFSPDDKQFVFNRFTGEGCQLITANSLDGSNERIIAQGKTNSQFLEPKWSPDGKKILFYDIERKPDGSIWTLSTISVDDGKINNILSSNKQRIWFVAWTKEGNILMNANDPISKLPQIYTVSYPEGKIERTTNDLFFYQGVSVGGNSILSTKQEVNTGLWVSDAEHLNAPPSKIITGHFDTFEWTKDGRIVFAATNGNDGKRHLWIMKADGTNKEQISPDEFDELLPDISPDNRFLTFISNRSGAYEIWTSEIDGSHPKQLTLGNPRVWHPRFASDGNSVFFETTKNEKTYLAKVTIADGQFHEIISDTSVIYYDISPDGKSVAYSFEDKVSNKTRVAIRSLETGEITKFIELAPARFLRFSLDGKSLIYKKSEESAPVSTVWTQTIDSGNERQLVDFKQDEIYWFDISSDGKQMSYISGKPSADLILLKSNLGKN